MWPIDRPIDRPILCVSIHDVAPATWADCLVLFKAMRAVAPDLPLTWLVVPRYHGRSPKAPAMEAALGQLLADGHELALHGYTHVDSAPRRRGLCHRFVREVYTTGEGEFSALAEDDALQRLDLGLAWFAERGWPVDGFVPPAWLASPGARRALRQRPFAYTTSLTHFHCLHGQHSVYSPSLMYAARNACGRSLSPPLARALALALRCNRLLRLGLHPADARHPALLRHAQALLEELLAQRRPMTKSGFAASNATPYPCANGAMVSGGEFPLCTPASLP
jgi:predicted deacetylase